MHPKTLPGPSQTQQHHARKINQNQYGSLSDTLSLTAHRRELVARLVPLVDWVNAAAAAEDDA